MAAYIGIAVTVVLALIGFAWHFSSRFTKLEIKVDRNSDKIEGLKNAIYNSTDCGEDSGEEG